jgi:gas vesicle protein GvpN
MLLFGDDEFKTSDLIGNQSGYTRKKVVDNFIHSVMKVEDELRHNWIDSRLTLACREGFTLVYDEFNRSRPEVNNVLLSALEEKLLVLPPSNNRAEYIRVSPHFRAIFTSNPEEYCGVHGTQDALQDRLITINMPEPDELAQQQILVQKVGIDAVAALQIVRLVKTFQTEVAPDMASSLRPSLIIATVCKNTAFCPWQKIPTSATFVAMCCWIARNWPCPKPPAFCGISSIGLWRPRWNWSNNFPNPCGCRPVRVCMVKKKRPTFLRNRWSPSSAGESPGKKMQRQPQQRLHPRS